MSKNIKIYIATHSMELIPSFHLFKPIQVGAELTDLRIDNTVLDNTGDNISYKNKSYCELTAHYWAWKNDEADYYGFFHYRRFLSFNLGFNKPYAYMKSLNEESLKKLNYNEKTSSFITQYDIIVPSPEEMHLSAYNQYIKSKNHFKKDINIVINIINEKYPEYIISTNEYMAGTKVLFGNIFILKKNIFYDYCEWLFGILNEYEKRADKKGYNTQEMRVEGFLAERLFGIYYTYLLKNKDLKIIELQRIDFLTGKNAFKKNALFYHLFPPESKRRYLLRRFTYDFKKD